MSSRLGLTILIEFDNPGKSKLVGQHSKQRCPRALLIGIVCERPTESPRFRRRASSALDADRKQLAVTGRDRSHRVGNVAAHQHRPADRQFIVQDLCPFALTKRLTGVDIAKAASIAYSLPKFDL